MSSGKVEISGSLEDYLETILNILADSTVARVRDIADQMNVSPASVTPAMKRLSEMNLIEYSKRNYIQLTGRGLVQARRVHTRHRLLRRFLSEVLGTDPAEAENDACAMEHHLSHSSVDRLAAFFEFLGQCPELRSILRNGFCCSVDEETVGGVKVNSRCPFMVSSERPFLGEPIPLCRAETGEEMLVARVDCQGDTRIDLIDMGFIQGSRVTVKRPPRDDYPMILLLDGWEIKLSRDLAECIMVTCAQVHREKSS